MKNLYAKGKGKGKIHPHSPHDALAVLAFLPAAILALTDVLGDEDKEVLAYLITRSLNGADTDKQRRCRKSQQQQLSSSTVGGGVHGPIFDCGCFECYTSFWIRWDSSPDRELIHQVIEAFEEHLASSEKKGKGGRRRERKEKGKKKKKEVEKEEEVVVEEKKREVVVVEEEEEEEEEEVVEVVEEEVVVVGEEEEVVGDETEAVVVGAGGGERRRSWPDVMGMFNSRLWSLWSPGV